METRRSVVKGAIGFAGVFAVGGIGVAVGGSEDLLRPPGGQDEARFAAACTKCNRCRSICPENAIVTSGIEDGFVNARMPKLDFHSGYCTFCGKCIDVCPTGALKPFDYLSERIGTAVIDEDRCLAWNQRGCDRCIDACSYEAITKDEAGRPVIDADKCNGCGICTYVCPASSFGSYSGDRKRGVSVEVDR